MIADILTKHMGGPDFKRMSLRLRNVIEQDPTLSDEVYRRLYENSSENVYDEDDLKAIKILSAVIDYLHEGQTEI
jgi:S-adenosylmethionine/arginine decarboxylase-like enzyme